MSKATKSKTDERHFHALDLLIAADLPPVSGLVVLVGDDRYLKQAIATRIESLDLDNPMTRRAASDMNWGDVVDELATVSLFSSGPRRLFVSDADELASRCKLDLEKFAANPPADSALLLDLKKLASNTKIYKGALKNGFVIECRCPTLGKSANVDKPKVFKWLDRHASKAHGVKLDQEARELLAELVDWNCGRLDRELAKLALFVDAEGKVGAPLVEKVVGGWRTQTTWAMIDKTCYGDAAAALEQLDQLIQSGESPQALFGSLAWSLRRFAAAVRLYEQRQRVEGKRPDLKNVLREAGFRPNETDKASAQLKQIGRERASSIYDTLLTSDLALKGSHAAPDRARFVLEKLILAFSKEAKPAAK